MGWESCREALEADYRTRSRVVNGKGRLDWGEEFEVDARLLVAYRPKPSFGKFSMTSGPRNEEPLDKLPASQIASQPGSDFRILKIPLL
jgi:hypothetical protein